MSAYFTMGSENARARARHISKLLAQPALGLQVPAESPLVTMETVRAVRRVDADTVLELVDAGALRWVWDVAANEDRFIRELRFWTSEVNAPEAVASWKPAEVIQQILGARAEWRGPEIAQLLIVSRPTVHRLQRELGAVLVGGVLKCSRAGLVKFLTGRLQ